MYLGNLSDLDRTIARWFSALSALIIVALTVTGVWQFLHHEATPGWSRHQLGGEVVRQPIASTGIAETHAAVADLAGILALFGVAWISARVLYRVSKFAVAALLLVIFSMITGTLMRFNAVYLDGAVLVDTTGYWQFFNGSVDGAVTDRYELGALTVVFWTIVHIISVPTLIVCSWVTLRNAETRRVAAKGQQPSWSRAAWSRRS